MLTQKLPNINAGQITVTGTAQSLEALISTAGGEAFIVEGDVTECDLQVESGTIRYDITGNTPTATKGFLLSSTGVNIVQFGGENINKLMLISTGGDAICNIQIGKPHVNV